MHILLQGHQTQAQIIQQITDLLHFLTNKYAIALFEDIDLSLNLLDAQGNGLELIDDKTGETYRYIEIKQNACFIGKPVLSRSRLSLVVDNTK
ncbi:MAG: hypothetical protein CMF38_05695 [Legionellaceae bacterium]|nr:hypothetical protein [Legionellaceae bacterium]HCA89922.1 hypothetical protein [Legionellales bacterium]|tara:strand:+ start:3962 stop:4240 length:279 start_codon:yes stop_codon:yes gene_type:complete